MLSWPINEDPLEFRGSFNNSYIYVSNNPVRLIDPRGLYEVAIFNGGYWGLTTLSPLKINSQCTEVSNSKSGVCDKTETKQYVLSGSVSVTASVLIVGNVRNSSGTKVCARTAANIAVTIAHEDGHVTRVTCEAQSYSSLFQGVFSSMSSCQAARQLSQTNINNKWNDFYKKERFTDVAGKSVLQESIDAGCE